MEHKPNLPPELSDDQLAEITGGTESRTITEESDPVCLRNTAMNHNSILEPRRYYFNPERETPSGTSIRGVEAEGAFIDNGSI